MSDAHALVKAYQDIIPDPEQFSKIIQTPLSTTFWVNALKITVPKLLELLQQQGLSAAALPWSRHAFQWLSDEPLGRRWEFLAGLVHIQEAVSMLPVMLLDPQPGDKVLDFCAAPGNKTAQIAIAMQNQGTVVANDRNYNRMRAFGQIMKRLGLVNVTTTIYDGVTYPNLMGYFDKVLVDAPCSCEGTIRKREEKVVEPDDKRSERLAATQKQLLKKAIKMCKPGGLIMYSTCTFSPIENEMVVQQALDAGRVEIVPITLANFNYSPGLTSWREHHFDVTLAHTIRIWPHQNDTGGFFMAMLRKKRTSTAFLPIEQLLSLNPIASATLPYLDELHQRFAIPMSVLESYQYPETQKGFYITSKENAFFLNPPPKINSDATGLFFLKTKMRFPKLTSAAAMLLASHVQRNRIALDELQFAKYIAKEDIVLEVSQIEHCTETGYVVITYRSVPVGVGLFFSPTSDRPPILRSLYPNYLHQNTS